jgi:NAD(P)-dependent dehydrogenase (short-subunit alcohol dehydrogenase family)
LQTIADDVRGGAVDALICAAGILLPTDDRYSAVDLEVWDRTQDVNVKGTVLTLRTFAPLMSTGSSVVTVASMAAIAGIPKRDAYTASKGAIVALTRAWAADLIRSGIRVNAVAPGVVATPMTADTRAGDEASLPLGRAATPDEIAVVIAGLVNPASSYLNGAIIPIDGGATAASRLVSLSPRPTR